jgi:hypothetical protein
MRRSTERRKAMVDSSLNPTPSLARQQKIVLRRLVEAGSEGRTNAFLSQNCCLNYGARIRELRKLGHVIEMKRGDKGLRTYILVGVNAPATLKEVSMPDDDWRVVRQGKYGLAVEYSPSRNMYRVNRGVAQFSKETMATAAMTTMEHSSAAKSAAATREDNRFLKQERARAGETEGPATKKRSRKKRP